MLGSDMVRSRVHGYLRGARKCGQRYNTVDHYAEVCMRLYLRGRNGAYEAVLPLLHQAELTPMEKGVITPPLMPPMPVPGVNAPPLPPMPPMPTPPEGTDNSANIMPHDGLIIEMSGKVFKPAIVNRILAEIGEVLLDPSKIVNAILVERGCGGYTNQVDKAKGLLGAWGSRNPLVLKAQETRKGTDVVISDESAVSVADADRRTNFLAQAKVVFVIN